MGIAKYLLLFEAIEQQEIYDENVLKALIYEMRRSLVPLEALHTRGAGVWVPSFISRASRYFGTCRAEDC